MANTGELSRESVESMMTAQEQQALRSAGISTDIIGRLIRVFLQTLLAELPGLVGAQQRPQIPARTSAVP